MRHLLEEIILCILNLKYFMLAPSPPPLINSAGWGSFNFCLQRLLDRRYCILSISEIFTLISGIFVLTKSFPTDAEDKESKIINILCFEATLFRFNRNLLVFYTLAAICLASVLVNLFLGWACLKVKIWRPRRCTRKQFNYSFSIPLRDIIIRSQYLIVRYILLCLVLPHPERCFVNTDQRFVEFYSFLFVGENRIFTGGLFKWWKDTVNAFKKLKHCNYKGHRGEI